MAHTARLAFSSYLGPEKSLQSSTTGALPEEAVWQGPTDALARSRSSSSEEIFLDPSTTRRQHLSAVLIREAILGRVTVLRCEMAPWRDWTSLTYMYGRSLWRGTYLWTGRGPGSGVTLDLRTYVHPGRACRFTYAVRWSDLPRKFRSGLTYFHFPVLIWQGNAIRSSRWIE